MGALGIALPLHGGMRCSPPPPRDTILAAALPLIAYRVCWQSASHEHARRMLWRAGRATMSFVANGPSALGPLLRSRHQLSAYRSRCCVAPTLGCPCLVSYVCACGGVDLSGRSALSHPPVSCHSVDHAMCWSVRDMEFGSRCDTLPLLPMRLGPSAQLSMVSRFACRLRVAACGRLPLGRRRMPHCFVGIFGAWVASSMGHYIGKVVHGEEQARCVSCGRCAKDAIRARSVWKVLFKLGDLHDAQVLRRHAGAAQVWFTTRSIG